MPNVDAGVHSRSPQPTGSRYNVQGPISVVSNVAPKPVADMVHAALKGHWTEARALHLKYYRLFTDLFIDTNPIPIKAAMAMAGLIEEVYRLPLCEMSDKLKNQLREVLKQLGIV